MSAPDASDEQPAQSDQGTTDGPRSQPDDSLAKAGRVAPVVPGDAEVDGRAACTTDTIDQARNTGVTRLAEARAQTDAVLAWVPPGAQSGEGSSTSPSDAEQAPGRAASGPRSRWWSRTPVVLGAGLLVGASVATAVTAAAFAVRDDDTVVARPALLTPEGVMDVQGILDRVQESVVTIETSVSSTGSLFEGSGTGVILSPDGLVLTNDHVITGAYRRRVRLHDGSEHDANLVGSSPSDDLAVIQIEDVAALTPAKLGSSDALQVGEPVIAIGNALNLGGQPTVTQGIVSAKDRSIEGPGVLGERVELSDLIQTDAAINPGNSGGPLVDAAGQVVGINTAIIDDSQNIGFAIAIDPVRSLIDDLRRGEAEISGDTAYLGVQTSDLAEVEQRVRDRIGIEADSGAFVVEVQPETSADEAGLEVGDVIVAVDGVTIETSREVVDAIQALEPGDEVTLTVDRAGQELQLKAELGRRG